MDLDQASKPEVTSPPHVDNGIHKVHGGRVSRDSGFLGLTTNPVNYFLRELFLPKEEKERRKGERPPTAVG